MSVDRAPLLAAEGQLAWDILQEVVDAVLDVKFCAGLSECGAGALLVRCRLRRVSVPVFKHCLMRHSQGHLRALGAAAAPIVATASYVSGSVESGSGHSTGVVAGVRGLAPAAGSLLQVRLAVAVARASEHPARLQAAWDALHRGDWHAVGDDVRRAYALGARVAGAAAAEAGDLDAALRTLDLGLMMGGPEALGQATTHALIARLEGRAAAARGGGGGVGAGGGVHMPASAPHGGPAGRRSRDAGGGKAARLDAAAASTAPTVPPPPAGDTIPRAHRVPMMQFLAEYMTPRYASRVRALA